MSKSLAPGTLIYPVAAAWFFALAALLVLWAIPSHAGQRSAQFSVLINLQSGGGVPNTGLCRSSSRIGVFGEAITVICSSGEPQDNAYRFVTLVSKAGELLGTVESYAGTGTITSWRVVSLSNLDYLELMVGW